MALSILGEFLVTVLGVGVFTVFLAAVLLTSVVLAIQNTLGAAYGAIMGR